ncbi:MAG TPA: methyltransferase domain-containing protein [Candidatus Baltobacteraceae bacterium]|nr:methyltransferase domain-containing protein [Verrucomicrobiae bacterium]HTX14058.1 methyltransferase domain-containing protein [Candidatus Baltobacteraceae bacterium]
MTLDTNQQQKDLIRDRFTRTADVFSSFAVPDRVASAESLAEMVAVGPADTVVDLATGPGTLALRFARRARWVCGLDLTPAMLAHARDTAASEGLSNLSLAIGDAQSLPFAANSLDIAVTSYSLHHMADPARVVAEMARVVRKGGRLGILDILAPEDPAVDELNHRIEITRDPSHTRSLSARRLENILAQAGMRVVGARVEEHPRSFDHWLHVAGWHRGNAEYEEARRLMESSISGDTSGFRPRYVAAGAAAPDSRPDMEIINMGQLVAAEKIG